LDDHVSLLRYLITNPNISSVSESSSDVDVRVLKELHDIGYVEAADACSDDGLCYLEPRITMQGRKWLVAQESPEDKGKPEDILELKPNFFGFGLNLRALFRRLNKHNK
jgi:hypothetical protein